MQIYGYIYLYMYLYGYIITTLYYCIMDTISTFHNCPFEILNNQLCKIFLTVKENEVSTKMFIAFRFFSEMRMFYFL